MDTTRALANVDPMEFEEPAQAARTNPMMMVHLLLQGRYWLVILLAIVFAGAGGLLGYKLPKRTYSSTGSIQIQPVVDPILFSNRNGSVPMYDGFVNAQIVFLTSERTVDMAMMSDRWLGHQRGNSPEESEQFRKNLDVERDGEIVRVTFTDIDAAVAVDAVRAIVDAYNKFYLASDLQSSRHQLQQLTTLSDEYGKQIIDLNKQITEISKGEGADAIKSALRNKIAEQDSAELAKTAAKHAYEVWELSHASVLATATSPATRAAPVVAKGPTTIEELAKIDPTAAQLLDERNAMIYKARNSGLGPKHPTVVGLYNLAAQMTDQLEAKLKNWSPPKAMMNDSGFPMAMQDDGSLSGDQLLLRQEQAESEYEDAHNRALALAKQVAEIHQQELEIDNKQRLRDTAKSKMEQLNVESAQEGRIEIISDGDRPQVIDNRKKIAAAAGFGGGVLGVGIVLVIGLLDRRLRTIDQARLQFKSGIRVLGMLPSLPKNLEDPGAASFAALCVHHIRMLLQVMPRLDSHPAIAVTSPSPGDGKTSLTLSLALSFAAAGKSTLLIDCDIVGAGLTRRVNAIIRRRVGQILIRENLITPAQLREALSLAQRTSRKLGEVLVDEGFVEQEQLTRALAMQAETSVGLLDVMRGEVLEECVADTGIARLWILPVGSALAEHGATISPEGFRGVLEQARKRFDVILIDTGPIPGSIESSVAASQADGVVLTVSRGEQGPLVRRANEHLMDLGARPLGIVFNRATPEDFSSSYGSMSSPSIPVRAAERPDAVQFGPMASAVAGNQTKKS